MKELVTEFGITIVWAIVFVFIIAGFSKILSIVTG